MTYLNIKNKKAYIKKNGFYKGHLIPKSPGLCYKLNKSFIELIKEVHNPNFNQIFEGWIKEESKFKRLNIIVESEKINKSKYIKDGHAKLIDMSIRSYAKNFLKGYEVIYVDDSDGDRVTELEKRNLIKVGIVFGQADDVWPDAILYNKNENSIWFIEAVTSDGEVDEAKMRGLKKICEKSRKKFGGATTTYIDYTTFAKRQDKNKNIALDSYIWIQCTPDKVFKVE
nr:BsuBI/PstI family type II restriction endonuclease [Clostridium sporogenes]